ncbi:MAG: formylglycine-generating enzyme family protein [candidate division Zixibacteria bacterium]|nr:formylglycine-generating enzyme family protein [candidate division Zixibacteria bacterium]
MRSAVKLLVGIALMVLIFTWAYPDNNNADSKMVLVDGGTFRMGNIFSEGDEDELPVHEVMLDAFYISKYEVTVGEFREFVKATGYKTTAETEGGANIFDGVKMVHDSSACWRNVNFKQSDNHPVIFVSWYDAVAYCNWLSTKEGLIPCYSGVGDRVTCNFEAKGYRLPTEAEYEFAARCRGKEYKYAWGNGEPYINDIKAANIRDEAALREWGPEVVKTYWYDYDDEYVFTSPVGMYAPNEQGVFDMSGNVYEWCWDWYNENYYRDSPSKNPRGPESGELRCCRDVGYGCLPEKDRSANRGKGKPGDRFDNVGFRLVRSAR